MLLMLATVVVALAAMAGCSGDEDDASPAPFAVTEDNTPAPPSRTFDVALRPEDAGALVIDPTPDAAAPDAPSPAPVAPAAPAAPPPAAPPPAAPPPAAPPPPPPFSIVSDNGLHTIVEGKSDRCSDDGDALTFTFTNQRAVPVTLYWVDHECSLLAYVAVAPGQTVVQSTFTTHRWRVADEARVHDFILNTAGAHYRITAR